RRLHRARYRSVDVSGSPHRRDTSAADVCRREVGLSTREIAVSRFHRCPVNVMRPGVFTRMLQSVEPAVIYSVFKSSPPKAQLVTSSFGTGTKSRSLPSWDRT